MLMAVLAATAPQLQSLCYDYPWQSPKSVASGLPAVVSQLSQLTRLSLGVGDAPVTTAQVDTLVQGLPSLRYLDLKGCFSFLMNGFPIGIVSSCSQLETLRIQNGHLGDVPPELGRLTRLTELVLGDHCTSLPESVSHLVRLKDVALVNQLRFMELPEQLWLLQSITRLSVSAEYVSLPNSISRLTALKELDMNCGHEFVLPLGLTACGQLTSMVMKYDADASVLGSLQSLRCLRLLVLPMPGMGRPGWTRLTGLTQLALDVTHCDIRQYAGITGMTTLRNLEIKGGMDLYEGPYLSRLQKLDMKQWNYSLGMPAALREATRLECLQLKPPHLLNAVDVDVLVRAVPEGLGVLKIVYEPTDLVSDEWKQSVSHLQAAFVSQGRAPRAVEFVAE